MEHAYRWCGLYFWCCFMACVVSSPVWGADHQGSASQTYSHRLYTPTLITKIEDNYFIVDCWHHRIIYSNSLATPISAWQVLDDDLAGPHSIASDGEIYVAEDTGRNRLKVYRQVDGKFRQTQVISDVGTRPHRVLYAQSLRRFLVIGSGNQVLYLYESKNGQLSPSSSRHIDELHGQYTRSITLVDDSIYFVGSEDIVRFRISEAGMRLMDQFTLASPYQGSNDLIFTGARSGIFTATPRRAVLFDDLAQLSLGTAKDISDQMVGTPYYGSAFDGYFWIPEITEHSRIVKYPMTSTGIRFDRGEAVFDFGPPNEASKRRKAILPL